MLQKGFLRNRGKLNISKKRFWLSVALGFSASFSFYTFLCFIRFFPGLLDFGRANYAVITEPSERYWENFNLAIISLVLGNALFLLNLFRKPDNKPVPSNVRIAIISDQRFLQFNFSYLLLKLGFMVSFFSISMETKISEMKFILVLVAIVFFLESWKSLLKYFKIKVYKPLFLNLSIIVTIAFCFAFTSVFPEKKMEAIHISSNPFVDLPISDFADEDYMPFRMNKLKTYKENNQLLYKLEDEKIEDFDLLGDYLKEEISEAYRNKLSIVLLMPQDISMDKLVKLENLLSGLGYRFIKYITKFSDKNLVSRFDNRGLVKELHYINTPNSVSNIPLPPLPKDTVVTKTIQVYLGEKVYSFESEKVKEDELVEYFVKHIDSATQFNYVFNNNSTYQSYITLFASQKQAIQDLRYNDQSVELKFGERFRPLNRKEYEKDRERLFNKFPLLITETYTE